VEVKELKMQFRYGASVWPDPDPRLCPDGVRAHYALLYSELVTAVVEDPVRKNGVLTYSFAKSLKEKG
jgi:PRTRC genetic system protein C